MTPTSVRHEISNLLDLLSTKGIALLVNPVVCNRVGNHARVTWHSPVGVATLHVSYDFASVDEYREHLRNQSYSAILCDGSLLQLSYDFYRDRLTGHRLCFYPCPFDIDPWDLEEDPVLDVVDLYWMTASDRLRLRSPLRFDFDRKNASEGHPVVHGHLLWAHCRCPVGAPFSLGHFVKFVFCNFYPRWWLEHEFLRTWKVTRLTRTITSAESNGVHFAF